MQNRWRFSGFVGICLVLTGVTSGPPPCLAQASRPQSYTEHDFYRESVPYFRSLLSDIYQTAGKKDSKWDAAAMAFLDRMAERFARLSVREFYRPADAPTDAQLIAEGQALTKLGCDDPLVAFCLGDLFDASGSPSDAVTQYRAALAAAGKPGFPDAWYIRAVPRIQELSSSPQDYIPLDRSFAKRQAGVLSGKLSGIARRQALRHLRSYIHTAQWRHLVLEELDARPDHDPWCRDILSARMKHDIAWMYRGNWAASYVTEDGWKGYFDNMKSARDELARAWKLEPKLPESCAQMLGVVMSQHEHRSESEDLHEDFIEWFQRAQAAQIDDDDLYHDYYIGRSAAWGGSDDEVLAMAESLLVHPRYDTLIPWQYVDCIKYLSNSRGESWVLLEDQKIRDHIIAMCEVYVTRQGVAHGSYFRSAHAAILVRAGELNEARKQLDDWTKVGGHADPSAFAYFGLGDGPVAVSRLYALTGAAGAGLIAAEELGNAGDAEAILSKLRDEKAKLPEGDLGRPYVDSRIQLTESRLHLEKGEWASIIPPGTVEGWWQGEGKWESDGKGQMIARDGDRALNGEKYAILSDASLKVDPASGFEMSVTIASVGVCSKNFAGVEIHSSAGQTYAACIEASPGEGRASFTFPPERKEYPVACKNGSQLLVHCQNNMVTLFVDGVKVGDPFELPEKIRQETRIGLGGWKPGVIRFSDIRVKKLK